jgi:CspA family cold shock protein
MRKGTVKFFDLKNKFGFITDEETKKDYYVHAKDLVEAIATGDAVVFELAERKKGPAAVSVRKA